MAQTKTLKVRVRDKHAKQLAQMARSVNFVWNFVNELSYRSISERQRFLSAYDLHLHVKYQQSSGCGSGGQAKRLDTLIELMKSWYWFVCHALPATIALTG